MSHMAAKDIIHVQAHGFFRGNCQWDEHKSLVASGKWVGIDISDPNYVLAGRFLAVVIQRCEDIYQAIAVVIIRVVRLAGCSH